MSKRYIVIPDSQVKPGVNIEYLGWIGEYITHCKPDVIIHLGDFWDMPSLSSYDFGKRQAEGRRVVADIDYANMAFQQFDRIIADEELRLKQNKKKQWNPEKHFLLGNHENRIQKAVDNDAKLEGLVGIGDLLVSQYADWEVHPFLESVILDGIAFSHYFTTGLAGRPAATASAQLNKQKMSCIAGHQQGLQVHTAYRGDGARLTGVIAGSCYMHNEDYLGYQGNNHWRGILRLEEVKDGEFDLLPISLNYLQKRYS